jgi:hypothetical protein
VWIGGENQCLIKVGKPHDRLCRTEGAADAVSELVAAFACLRRRGASSTKVQGCLWNWHITQAAASGEMTQRLFLRRHPSQGRSGRMLGPRGLGASPKRALVGDVMVPLTVLLAAVVGSIREGGTVESMTVMGVSGERCLYWRGPSVRAEPYQICLLFTFAIQGRFRFVGESRQDKLLFPGRSGTFVGQATNGSRQIWQRLMGCQHGLRLARYSE